MDTACTQYENAISEYIPTTASSTDSYRKPVIKEEFSLAGGPWLGSGAVGGRDQRLGHHNLYAKCGRFETAETSKGYFPDIPSLWSDLLFFFSFANRKMRFLRKSFRSTSYSDVLPPSPRTGINDRWVFRWLSVTWAGLRWKWMMWNSLRMALLYLLVASVFCLDARLFFSSLQLCSGSPLWWRAHFCTTIPFPFTFTSLHLPGVDLLLFRGFVFFILRHISTGARLGKRVRFF